MDTLPDTLREVLAIHGGHVPVPVVSIAQEVGITIYETTDLAADEMAHLRKEGKEVVLYLNSSYEVSRQRFSIALAIVFHAENHPVLVLEEGITIRSEQPVEYVIRAASLLMPEKELAAAWAASSSLEELAAQFEVPVGAAAIRGSDLFNVVRI